MAEPTTNAAIRERYENGQSLNDGAPENTGTDSPANGAATTVAEDIEVHVVTADGTNTVDLSNVEEEGYKVTVVHNGGANTPTVAFDDADFISTGPANMTSQGATATVKNIDGSSTGWVVVATGSA
ncbi:hypothetical protein VB779_08655 [Haloarculaceae archaeon H-GB11]|nr:hypothetical protein [Haloarculaceae archaeon H-GB11]